VLLETPLTPTGVSYHAFVRHDLGGHAGAIARLLLRTEVIDIPNLPMKSRSALHQYL
jgi:hypothetical protein